MSPLVRAAVLLSVLSALTRAAETKGKEPSSSGFRPSPAGSSAELSSVCPQGTLPDANVCIPVWDITGGAAELAAQQNAHRERSGRWRVYEQIPRRPERPADYRSYRLPVTPLPNQSFVTSGYDLHLPDAEQRRGAELSAVGHGGIDIAQKRGTEVRVINLEHQIGNAEVLYVGVLFGNSVVTRHTLREGGKLREYIVIFGHLDGPAAGLKRGATLREGSLIGFVGDSGSPGVVHLHLEVRRIREQVNIAEVGPGELTQNAKSVVCDPRNVLPMSSG